MPSDTDQTKARLLQLKAELEDLAEASREAHQPVQLDQASVGRLSRMDAMQGQQMAKETARRRQEQLSRIDGALRRLEGGEYGKCFVCGEDIEARRLEADPTATRCVGCMAESTDDS